MRVMITAGPTREYLDDVRYLSNASSGRMGYALAEAVRGAGHEVVLITGPVLLLPPNGCTVIAVETTDDLLRACRAE
ncbi:MAG: phosphopantothenoylcysteine decarboxylase, partial [Planctomycetaceae bacterium]|nr:phosphopantothenoylcysteine decarboxylase [Planctomycetaceae bacterium]